MLLIPSVIGLDLNTANLLSRWINRIPGPQALKHVCFQAAIQLGLLRSREYNADMSAAELTGNPEPLASALARIDKFQKNPLNRLIWPMMPRLPQASWLRTHPPTKERIRRLL
jgi:Zn-dependent protease with chaperone function